MPVELKIQDADSRSVLVARTKSIIAGEHRQVEVWSVPPGTLLRVSGGSDFCIAPSGKAILPAGRIPLLPVLSELDREILLGPVLVLALAMCGTWSLHASAIRCQDKTIAFVGESGRGKSTLAAFLSQAGWRLVADDILPVTSPPRGLVVWPHFPQLKLPVDRQPGPGLPEALPLTMIFELAAAASDDMPKIELLPPEQAVRILLSHMAGTRLFSPTLLAAYLDFCARAAERMPVFRLAYPHRNAVLPEVKKLLQNIC